MGILPPYLSIYLIVLKSHNNKRCCLQRRCLFCTIYHLPHAVYPTNKLNLLSKSAHVLYPNNKGLNIAPFSLISKRHNPVSHNSLTSCCDFSLSAGCIRIQNIPYAIQSVLSKVGLLGSNISNTD